MVSFDWGSASQVDDVTALPSRHKMADMCYYGNVMTTTRWWLCVTILHLQQYSYRLNLFFSVSFFSTWTIISLYISLSLLLSINVFRIFFPDRWCCLLLSMFLSLFSSLILSLRVYASVTVAPFFRVSFFCRFFHFSRWFSLMSPVLWKG